MIMTKLEPTRIDFDTADYPNGLIIQIDGKRLCSYHPKPQTIDGTGWAEAAFEPSPPKPMTSTAQLDMLDAKRNYERAVKNAWRS